MLKMKYDADDDLAALSYLHDILFDIASNINEPETGNKVWALLCAEQTIIERLSRYVIKGKIACE